MQKALIDGFRIYHKADNMTLAEINQLCKESGAWLDIENMEIVFAEVERV